MLQIFGFTPEEECYVILTAMEIAGLLIASKSSVKSSDQTIVNEAYGETQPYMFREKEEKCSVVGNPEGLINEKLKEKSNTIWGFVLTAIGMWLSSWINTEMPDQYAGISVIIITIIWILLGLAFNKIVRIIKVKRIVKKLKNGELKPTNSMMIRVLDNEK